MTVHNHAYDSEDRGSRCQRVRGGRAAAPAAGPPRRRDRRADRGRQRRHTLLEHQPHLLPLADRVLLETTAETLAGPRRRLPRAAARSLGRARRRNSATTPLVIDCGADHRLTRRGRLAALVRRRARGHLAVRPARAPRPARAARRRQADRRPRLLPDGVLARARARVPPTSSSPRSWSSRCPARPARASRSKTNLLGLGGDGLGQRVRRRRRPPAHPRDRAEPLSAAAGRSRSVVHAGPRADAARHPRHLHRDAASRRREDVREVYEKAYADEPFVHLLPEGIWPTTGAVLGSNAVQLQVTVDEDLDRLVVVAAIDNLDQGHRGCRRPVHEPRARPAGDHRPVDRGSRTVNRDKGVTGPQGFRAAGIAAGHQGVRRSRPDPRRERRAAGRRRRCLHHEQGEGRAGAVVPAGDRVATTHRGRAQLRRRQRVHRPRGLPGHARHRREGRRGARHRRDRRRGLLHRPDRRAPADGQDPHRRRDRPRRSWRRRRSCRSQRRHRRDDHGHRPKQSWKAIRAGLVGRRLRQGRGHARPEHGHDAVGHHHRRRDQRRDTLDAALRAVTARRSTVSTSTAARPRTTPCSCWRPARPGSSPRSRTSRRC